MGDAVRVATPDGFAVVDRAPGFRAPAGLVVTDVGSGYLSLTHVGSGKRIVVVGPYGSAASMRKVLTVIRRHAIDWTRPERELFVDDAAARAAYDASAAARNANNDAVRKASRRR